MFESHELSVEITLAEVFSCSTSPPTWISIVVDLLSRKNFQNPISHGGVDFFWYNQYKIESYSNKKNELLRAKLTRLSLQVDPAKYGNILKGFKVTVKEDGVRGLSKGWAPTFIGYSMQGLCKFGFYEVFKILYGNMLGEVSVINCDLIFTCF